MARQPLHRRYHKGPWSVGIGMLDERPDHARIIGQCLTMWPEVEITMALLLAILMKANSNDAAVAVYLSIRAGRGRKNAMEAAAHITLSAQDFELFGAVMIVFAATEAKRNHLAHGNWGVCEAVADGVLWVQSENYSKWILSQIRREPTPDDAAHSELAKHLFVYKTKDLMEVKADIVATRQIIADFIWYLRRDLMHGGIPSDVVYLQLCSEPRIAGALHQMRTA
jgi:hypothetical protein